MRSGRASALGRTQGNGPVDPSIMIASFLGNGGNNVPTNAGSAASVGVEDDISGIGGSRNGGSRNGRRNAKRQFGNLLGGFRDGNGGQSQGNKNDGPAEQSVAAAFGKGASSGLPTASDNGEVTMTYRQVCATSLEAEPFFDNPLQINQDGAGPMTADIDGTSGGSDPDAFQIAEITENVPGVFQGLSLATNTDFPLKVRMPQGMTCDGNVGGAHNVCIVRVRNGAAAGPFGGSAAFTQSATSRKRAIAYRLKKRMEINRMN